MPFSIVLWNSKTKSKPSGLPDSNFIFFVVTKKTKQKKALRCAWHILLVSAAASIQLVLNDYESTLPSQNPRLLRASPFFEGCLYCCSLVFTLFPSKSDRKVRPFDTGPDPHHVWFLKSQKSGKRDALRKEQGVFAYFCRRLDKSKASGGTRPAGLACKDLNVKKLGNITPSVALATMYSRQTLSSIKRPAN